MQNPQNRRLVDANSSSAVVSASRCGGPVRNAVSRQVWPRARRRWIAPSRRDLSHGKSRWDIAIHQSGTAGVIFSSPNLGFAGYILRP